VVNLPEVSVNAGRKQSPAVASTCEMALAAQGLLVSLTVTRDRAGRA
jgi:hypothetical protein